MGGGEQKCLGSRGNSHTRRKKKSDPVFFEWKNSRQKTGNKINSTAINPTLTVMDCVYLCLSKCKDIYWLLRNKIRAITMNNSTSFPLVTTSSLQKNEWRPSFKSKKGWRLWCIEGRRKGRNEGGGAVRKGR